MNRRFGRMILECGGKRSATPLLHQNRRSLHAGKRRRRRGPPATRGFDENGNGYAGAASEASN